MLDSRALVLTLKLHLPVYQPSSREPQGSPQPEGRGGYLRYWLILLMGLGQTWIHRFLEHTGASSPLPNCLAGNRPPWQPPCTVLFAQGYTIPLWISPAFSPAGLSPAHATHSHHCGLESGVLCTSSLSFSLHSTQHRTKALEQYLAFCCC